MVDIDIDEASSEVPPPAPPAKKARWGLRIVTVMVVVLLLAAAGGGLWVKGKIDPSGPPGDVVAVDIPRGASTSEIAEQLAEEARLVTRYTELTSRPDVEFRGQKYTLMGVAKFFTDGDRSVREDAHRAREQFLVGIGLRRLSMSPRSIPIVRERLRSLRADRLEATVEKCLALATADEVRSFLERTHPVELAVA